jgi:putative efflux protein, MATE family
MTSQQDNNQDEEEARLSSSPLRQNSIITKNRSNSNNTNNEKKEDESQLDLLLTTSSTSSTNANNLQDHEHPEELAREEDYSPYPLLSNKEHFKQLFKITGPIVVSEVFQNTLPVVDLAFVGNLPGKNDLAAAALATVWFNLWNATMLGFMTSIDTMLSQSFGAKDLKAFSIWTGNSIMVVIWVSFVISGLIALCEPCMVLFGQDKTIAAAAGEFSYRLIPGLMPYYIFKTLTKYLQTQNIVAPSVYIGLIANGFNVLINWVFIYELDMGLRGAPWATTLTRFFEMGLVMCYIYWKRRDLVMTIPSFALENMRRTSLVPFLRLSLSGALSFAFEAWSFEITTILAGLISTVALDAHVVTLSIATLIYLSFPFAVGIATSIRVGQLIGEGSPADAKRSCVIAYGVNFAVQLVLIIVVLSCSRILGELFSSDKEVADLIDKLLPLSCIFMMGDAFQANTGGTMRGLGRQQLVLLLNILGFWVLAMPIGAILTFALDIGVAGLWWGFTIGIYSAAIIGILFLWIRVDWKEEASKAKTRIATTERTNE